MKKIIAILFLFSAISFAQYTPVTITDIQKISNDSLKIADSLGIGANARWTAQTSPYNGQDVEITALVVVPPHVITYTARGRAMVVCDTGAAMNQPWSHIFVRYGGTSSNTADDEFDADGYNSIQAGDIITMKGKISEFPTVSMNSLTQFTPAPGEGVVIISSGNPLPAPHLLNISDINKGANPGGTVLTSGGEPYEAQEIMFTNVTVIGNVNQNRGTWAFTDAQGNQFSIYDWSYHFTLDTTSVDRVPSPKDLNYKVPALGTKIDTIKGFISTSSGQESPRGYRICPMYPEDVKYGGILPSVTTHRRYPVVVSKDTTATITAKVYKQQGSYDIASAKLVYRVNNGAWVETTMVAAQVNVDSTFSATIPKQNAGDYVYYFVKGIDANNQETILANSGNLSQYDSSAGFFFYQVIDRSVNSVLSIKNVQYTPFKNGRSSILGAVDSVGGIITADTSALNISSISGTAGTSAWYMQSTNQPWSGIWLVGPDSVMNKLHIGDSVVATGSVQENFDVTRLSVSSARVVSQGNTIPQPVEFTTDVFGSGVPNGDANAEPYEGMLVKFSNVTVSDVNPTFSEQTEFEITNSSKAIIVRRDGRNTYSNLVSDSASGYTILRVGNKIGSLTGIIYYAGNRYKVEPRTNADFSNVTGVSIAYKNTIPNQYALLQNYPNPFNPSTTIRYELPANGFTVLKVYNILGQEVAQLVNETQNAGVYNVSFDASHLASGMYVYKLTVGDFVQIKKMMLLK